MSNIIMKLAGVLFLLTLLVILVEQTDAKSRRCRDCSKAERSRKKAHRERRKSQKRGASDIMEPPGILPVTAGLRMSESQQAKYLEDLAKSHPFLFEKKPSPRVLNKYPINHYTQAMVDAVVTENGFARPLIRVVGKFGHHSRHENLFGRMVHVLDSGRNGSHFGCNGDIENKRVAESAAGPWIALIARGKCTFLVKIKLAERFNASAVVVYNTEKNGEVEVMRTLGTRATSLMIDSKAGNRLAALASSNLPVYLNISVGAINIQTMDKPSPVRTRTKAIVDIHTQEGDFQRVSLHKTTGYFGMHSPQESISGKVVHIQDFETEDSHYGCSGSIFNENEVALAKAKWIALVARGKCSTVVKVKLAEKYSANAVVIYDTKLHEKNETINAIGANITALSINMTDGRKALRLLREGREIYMDIGVETPQGKSSGGQGDAYALRYSYLTFVVTLWSGFTILILV